MTLDHSIMERARQHAAQRLAPEMIPRASEESLNAAERGRLVRQIKAALRKHNAVLVAHYYTAPELQSLAEETGGCVADSLGMARFGTTTDADTLVVCGVRFMAETARILNPEKRVLAADDQAECSLDIGCPADQFARFCDQHPDRTVIVYANTSAAVKARADWVVTSGSAVDIVRHLTTRGERLIWAPDRYLGDYIHRQTGADMLLWDATCIVHEEFKGEALRRLRQRHPEARVLVHPESPAAVIEQADVVGSTAALIRAARASDADTLIVATDRGIFHKMQAAAPDKHLIEAPTGGKGATCISCGHCPWMAMNSLGKVARVLETGANEIRIDPGHREKALVPIRRLLDFTAGKDRAMRCNDA